MSVDKGTFDTPVSKGMTLGHVISLFGNLGVRNLYVKCLAPNDNSKNQPYFGSHLTDIAFLPTGNVAASETTSTKTKDPKRQIKYTASLDLSWLDAEGKTYKAPHAKLIYYPQYPEVRFSGFLRGSTANLNQWMDPYKKGRCRGRWLILGVSENKQIYTYLVTPECALSKELESTELSEVSSVFGRIGIDDPGIADTREALLGKLLQIHRMGWVPGQRLAANKVIIPYRAQNGGGYTLESLLGISPNGIAEPDYLVRPEKLSTY